MMRWLCMTMKLTKEIKFKSVTNASVWVLTKTLFQKDWKALISHYMETSILQSTTTQMH